MELSKQIKTKIVATLGPASANYEIITELIKAGVSMFRLNTSHGSEEMHKSNIELIRKASAEQKKYIPVLVDLQGPKIRVGNIPTPVEIRKGMEITLTPNEDYDKTTEIPVDYKDIAKDVNVGDKIMLDDGKIGLEVLAINENKVKTKVLYGKEIKPRKGINVPTAAASLSAVTPRDINYIKFAIENNASYLALSFVRNKEDIELA